MLLYHTKLKGYSSGWAANQFKKKCGDWPPFHWNDMAPIPPNKRVQNYIRSRQIAYAKMREKQAAHG